MDIFLIPRAVGRGSSRCLLVGAWGLLFAVGRLTGEQAPIMPTISYANRELVLDRWLVFGPVPDALGNESLKCDGIG
jgi:hypothetical protein